MRKPKKELGGLDLSIYTKNGTLRKRKQKTSRNYFTQETEDAIIAYNKSTSEREKNSLFNEYINHSLHKLAENIIHTFKFYYTDLDNVEDLKHEVVCFLIEKLPLYHHSKYINDQLVKISKKNRGCSYANESFNTFTGNTPVVTQSQIDEFINTLTFSGAGLLKAKSLYPPKAYSYFGTIAKRHLIVYNEKQYKLQKDRKEIEHVDEDKKILQAAREEVDNTSITHFVKSFIRFVELNIDEIHETRVIKDNEVVKDYVIFTDKDKAIVYTVLNLFKKVEELEIFYKPALYLYIREATGQKTVDITRVIKILKCIMQQQLSIYYKKGAIDIDESDIYNSINM